MMRRKTCVLIIEDLVPICSQQSSQQSRQLFSSAEEIEVIEEPIPASAREEIIEDPALTKPEEVETTEEPAPASAEVEMLAEPSTMAEEQGPTDVRATTTSQDDEKVDYLSGGDSPNFWLNNEPLQVDDIKYSHLAEEDINVPGAEMTVEEEAEVVPPEPFVFEGPELACTSLPILHIIFFTVLVFCR